MTTILLINPNSSQPTTDMMVAIARNTADGQAEIRGVTARRGPSMIVTEAALAAAAGEVVAVGIESSTGVEGIIVSAFGDPGLDELRRHVAMPVIGICEASMLEASINGRRFGVATTTPDLVRPIDAKAASLGLGSLYTGVRLTEGDAFALVADPQRLADALAAAVAASFEQDGAEAVIIGGGPLGQAAVALEKRFAKPVIGPIPAAVRRLLRR
jgi:Asp/Glu/hydantoin racemase